MNMIYIYCCNK